jgi:hypothetical protein
MTEPRISGPPKVVGWDTRVGGPRLEVPLSIPVDPVWMEAQAQLLSSLADGISLMVDATGPDEAGRLIVAFGWPKKEHTPEVVTVRAGSQRTWTVAEGMAAVQQHLEAVARLAATYRERIVQVEGDIAAWWKAAGSG